MFRLFLIIIVSLFINIVFSQDDYKLKFWNENKAYKNLKDYFIVKYERDTTKLIYIEKIIEYCYKNKDYKQCTQYFDKGIHTKNQTLYIYCGRSYKHLEKFYEAKEIFEKGIKIAQKNKNRESLNVLNQEVESINWVIKNNKKTSAYHQSNIYLHNNFSNILSLNWFNESLILTIEEKNSSNNNILITNLLDSNSIKTKNNLSNSKIGTLTQFDINKFYISVCDTLNNCKIGIGSLRSDSLIINNYVNGLLSNELNSTFTMPHFFNLNNKNYLLFCSNKEDSKGGLDIYLGELLKEDSISNIRNLNSINTIYDDITPFIDLNDTTLYFSNSWMYGYGGLDIFKTKFKELKSSKIENLGMQINSSNNDFNFRIKDSVYTLISNREIDKNCCNKYYHFSKNKSINNQKDSLKIVFVKEKDSLTIQNLNFYTKSYDTNKVFNELKKLEVNFPVKLYFHNDIPDPKSIKTTTKIDYGFTYNEYIKLKKEYMFNNASSFENKINDFFLNEITKGFNDLNKLTKLLSEHINDSIKFKLIIKGFASPLAPNKYNVNLSKRRISSLINYLIKYNNGELANLINKKIIFEFIPFGEDKADKMVSDNPKNVSKSIYSIEAALERKIEIIGIKIIQ